MKSLSPSYTLRDGPGTGLGPAPVPFHGALLPNTDQETCRNWGEGVGCLCSGAFRRALPRGVRKSRSDAWGVGAGARGDVEESLKTLGLRDSKRVCRHLTGSHFPDIRDGAGHRAR